MSDDVEPLRELLPDWNRHLRATNKSPNTISTYLRSADEFVCFLEAEGLPSHAEALDTTHDGHHLIERFIVHVQDRPHQRTGRPVTAGQVAKHYRHLQQLCRWLDETEDLITVSPFTKTKPPAVPEQPKSALTEAQLSALIAACAGKAFENRRDEALIRLFIDTGARADEIATLRLARPAAGGETETDLDFDTETVRVMGKGRRVRVIPFGATTGEALRRYVRARRRHGHASKTDALWLGRKGGLTADGIRALLDRRADAAGVPHTHPHLFRHTLAHRWLANDGTEGDLMRIMGWRSREMVDRYAAGVANERARDAHRRARLADDL